MRTQFLMAGLLGAAGLVGAAGCDNITAGQPSDPSGPPQIVHVMVQDTLDGSGSRITPGARDTAVDLVDNATPQVCSDTLPCTPQFLFAQQTPDFSCSATMQGQQGTCNDPLKVDPAVGVPLFVPASAPSASNAGSGFQIRVVFNKLLDNSIEMIGQALDKAGNPVTTPGKTNTYKLVPTVAKLVDPMGKEVPSVKIYDNGGAPNFDSDLILVPYGPAIVIKPKAPLIPKTKYTIQLDGTAIKDRQGNTGVDQNGSPLGSPYSLSFTTEGVVLGDTSNSLTGTASFPDFNAPSPGPPARMLCPKGKFCIAPNDVIQLFFWTSVDPATAKVTLTGPSGIQPEVNLDQGSDPTMCMANSNPNVLDVWNTTGTGATTMPVAWPKGDYTMMVSVASDQNPMATFSKTLMFTVATCNPMGTSCTGDTAADCCSGSCTIAPGMTTGKCDPDGNEFSQHPIPEQCTG